MKPNHDRPVTISGPAGPLIALLILLLIGVAGFALGFLT